MGGISSQPGNNLRMEYGNIKSPEFKHVYNFQHVISSSELS